MSHTVCDVLLTLVAIAIITRVSIPVVTPAVNFVANKTA